MTVPTSLQFTGQVYLSPQVAMAGVLTAAAHAKLPMLTAWRADGGAVQQGVLGLHLAAVQSTCLDLKFGPEHRAWIDQSAAARQARSPWCEVRFLLPTRDGYRVAVQQAQAIARHLLEHGALAAASVQRGGGGGACCVPEPPIAERHVLIVAHHDDIERAYADPSVFHAAWDDGCEHDGYSLGVRAADASTGPEFLGAIQEHQWALARAARPGLTRYPAPLVDGAEDDIYRAAPARLEEVGYLAPAGIVEFTSVYGPDQHLAGWEIDRLAAMVREGRMGDGRPVEQVRVLFLDPLAAERQKRPLLDLGVRVLTLGDDGRDLVLSA